MIPEMLRLDTRQPPPEGLHDILVLKRTAARA
jgi:hypothetical protein